MEAIMKPNACNVIELQIASQRTKDFYNKYEAPQTTDNTTTLCDVRLVRCDENTANYKSAELKTPQSNISLEISDISDESDDETEETDSDTNQHDQSPPINCKHPEITALEPETNTHTAKRKYSQEHDDVHGHTEITTFNSTTYDQSPFFHDIPTFHSDVASTSDPNTMSSTIDYDEFLDSILNQNPIENTNQEAPHQDVIPHNASDQLIPWIRTKLLPWHATELITEAVTIFASASSIEIAVRISMIIEISKSMITRVLKEHSTLRTNFGYANYQPIPTCEIPRELVNKFLQSAEWFNEQYWNNYETILRATPTINSIKLKPGLLTSTCKDLWECQLPFTLDQIEAIVRQNVKRIDPNDVTNIVKFISDTIQEIAKILLSAEIDNSETNTRVYTIPQDFLFQAMI